MNAATNNARSCDPVDRQYDIEGVTLQKIDRRLTSAEARIKLE
jgi:hypothetical protein